MRRLPQRFAAGLVAVVIVLLAGIAPASAHGGRPVLSVENAYADGTSVIYAIRAVYQDDGDPVPGLSISAIVVGADGAEQPPVPVPPGEGAGSYLATVPFPGPGSWQVRFVVADHADSTLQTPQEISFPTTMAPSTLPEHQDFGETTSAPPITAEPVVASTDDGAPVGMIVVLVAAVAAVVGAVFVRYRRTG